MALVVAQRGGGGAGAILETTSERAAAKDTFGALRVPTLPASPPRRSRPHSRHGAPPRPGRLPSGTSWQFSHWARAGFWRSAGTHSLLILSALQRKAVYKIQGHEERLVPGSSRIPPPGLAETMALSVCDHVIHKDPLGQGPSRGAGRKADSGGWATVAFWCRAGAGLRASLQLADPVTSPALPVRELGW